MEKFRVITIGSFKLTKNRFRMQFYDFFCNQITFPNNLNMLVSSFFKYLYVAPNLGATYKYFIDYFDINIHNLDEMSNFPLFISIQLSLQYFHVFINIQIRDITNPGLWSKSIL